MMVSDVNCTGVYIKYAQFTMRHINREDTMSNSMCACARAQVHLYGKRPSLVGQAQLEHQHLVFISSNKGD